MSGAEVIRKIAEIGIVPVVRARSSEEAASAIEAIREGGIDVLEVTMTVPGAVRLIERLVEQYEERALIGAGTVLDAETARACILAGARFIVSPALDERTIEVCRRYSVAVMPGALTPTEIVRAWQAGADAVKVFPCSAMGGASYIRALKGPLPQIELVPTGGVTLGNAAEHIRAGALALGVGTDLVDVKELRAGRAHIITERARQFLDAVREARQEAPRAAR
jgi:2-dehydro-3-deoxyphosphogluconate aldolase/(4S)-4-hydroxy-2-oxoglutarate aldolase